MLFRTIPPQLEYGLICLSLLKYDLTATARLPIHPVPQSTRGVSRDFLLRVNNSPSHFDQHEQNKHR